jgi:large conductance mechanosensitive channel
MWKEFKAFIMRGNVMDMAVGIIIGVAFGAIISSLVNDIIMPPVGLVLGRINFSDLFISLNGQTYASVAAAKQAGAPTINYGNFVNTIINFLIIAIIIFFPNGIVGTWQEMRERKRRLAGAGAAA